MLFFQRHAGENDKQVCEYGKLVERGGRAEDCARDGGRQKQDPSSRPAGEEGESMHHFDIQLPPIVP